MYLTIKNTDYVQDQTVLTFDKNNVNPCLQPQNNVN